MEETKQRLTLEDRRELLLSGIRQVISFDDVCIELDSSLGGIEIGGAGLKIASLDLEAGQVAISGRIDSITYVKSREERSVRRKGKNAVARLLK